MKNFLRIAIVVLLLVGIGFGTYAIFFKPANDEAVFLALSEVGSEEEIDTWDEMYKGLFFTVSGNVVKNAKNATGVSTNHAGKYKTVVDKYNVKLGITGSDFTGAPKTIDDVKDIKTDSEPIAKLNADGTVQKNEKGEAITESTSGVYTYPYIKTLLDDVFSNYVSYTQAVTKDVDKSELSEIKKLVEGYKTSFEDVNVKFKAIESLFKQICSSADVEDLSVELEMRYQNAVVSYRQYVSSYANLVERTISFVREYVFDDAANINLDTATQEMAVKYIKSFSSGAYSYQLLDEAGQLGKRTADLRNKQANRYVSLLENGSASAVSLKYIAEDTVTYSNTVYEKKIGYLVDNLIIKVGTVNGNENTPTFNDSTIVVSGATVSGNSLTMLGETFVIQNGVATIDDVMFEQVGSKMYMYLAEDVDKSGKVEFEGQVKYTMNVAAKTGSIIFPTGGTPYTVPFAMKEFYEISSNRYGINDSKEVCLLSADKLVLGEKLNGATYNTYSQVSTTITGGASSIDKKVFNNAYKKVFENDPTIIDTIINMSLEDMRKLENGNADLVSTFKELIQAELRILIAYTMNMGV